MSDTESPWRLTFPRCQDRIDYALRGKWTADPEVNKDGVVVYSKGRLLYLGLTVLFACPFAIAIDLLDWLSFPLGRLLGAITAVLFIRFIL